MKHLKLLLVSVMVGAASPVPAFASLEYQLPPHLKHIWVVSGATKLSPASRFKLTFIADSESAPINWSLQIKGPKPHQWWGSEVETPPATPPPKRLVTNDPNKLYCAPAVSQDDDVGQNAWQVAATLIDQGFEEKYVLKSAQQQNAVPQYILVFSKGTSPGQMDFVRANADFGTGCIFYEATPDEPGHTAGN